MDHGDTTGIKIRIDGLQMRNITEIWGKRPEKLWAYFFPAKRGGIEHDVLAREGVPCE